jgi:hypothetical protein
MLFAYERPLCANIGRSTNCHALVVLDTSRRPNDADLAALTHSPTTFVHNLGSRLRCVKCAKVGIHLGWWRSTSRGEHGVVGHGRSTGCDQVVKLASAGRL